MTARIAFIADLHHGQDRDDTSGSQALPLLEQALAGLDAGLVVELGDRIAELDPAADAAGTAAVAELFRRHPARSEHLHGNHDVPHLAPAALDALLPGGSGHRVVEWQGVRLLLFAADVRRAERGFMASEADLAWLAQALAPTGQPAILCSHFPLDGHGNTQNWWFHNAPRFQSFGNLGAIQEMLWAAPDLVACVAGHAHWHALTTPHDIACLTIPSLTGTALTPPEPCAAVAELTLSDGWLDWRVSGLSPRHIRLPLRRPGARWAAPRPPR